jgi:hypothetical protein
MEITIIIAVLLLGLIYLHAKQSHIVLQPDIKSSKKLTLTALVFLAISRVLTTGVTLAQASNSSRGEMSDGTVIAFVGLLILEAIIWILVLVAIGKLFAGCYKVAFFKKEDLDEPSLRRKVRGILLKVIDRKFVTTQYEMFTQVTHDDPLVESIRKECKEMCFSDFTISEEHLEKLGEFAEKLKG